MDQDNQEKQDLLPDQPVQVNASDRLTNITQKKSKKKRNIIIGVITTIIVIGAALGVTLPLALAGGGDDDLPTDPFAYSEFNLFSFVNDTTYKVTPYSIQFTLQQKDINASEVKELYKGSVEDKLPQYHQKAKKLMRNQTDGYTSQASKKKNINSGYKGTLYKPVNPSEVPVGTKNNAKVSKVQFKVDLIDNYQARILISDTNQDLNYTVREDVFKRPQFTTEARLSQLGFNYSIVNDTFNFEFRNIYTQERVLSTHNRKFMMSEKFSEIGFVMPTQRVFGLGHRNGQFMLQQGTYTLWSKGRDQFTEYFVPDNGLGGLNGPSVHPFVMCQTQHKGEYIGMFFLATTPQVLEIINFPGYKESVLNYIQLGGALEIYFFMRGTATQIIKNYHALIGYSTMPPYYALGFFQGSNSYSMESFLDYVLSNYAKDDLPLEGMIIEDYNDDRDRIFTWSYGSWKTLPNVTRDMHARNQRMILGVYNVIAKPAYGYTYLVLNKAREMQCMVKSTENNGYLFTNFMKYKDNGYEPDFFHPNITALYTLGVLDLDTQLMYGIDGWTIRYNQIFTQLNGEIQVKSLEEELVKERRQLSVEEIRDEINGQCNRAKAEYERRQGLYLQDSQPANEEAVGVLQTYKINLDEQDRESTYYLPFVPGYQGWGFLDNHTVSLNATHYSKDGKFNNQFYLHNAYGHMSLKTMYEATTQNTNYTGQGKRQLLMSESTFPGSGAYGGTWIGDIERGWNSLRLVIAQVMSFGMFGINMAYTDVCGDAGNRDEELCGRWMQLGAFLPAVRGYWNMYYWNYTLGTLCGTDQAEFFIFYDKDMKNMTRQALYQRLSYTRYIYSQLYLTYREGGSLVKPLFFDYPEDDNCFQDVEDTYMLGDSIKVSPVLDRGVKDGDEYTVYFPAGMWHDLNDMKTIIKTNGDYIKLKASNTQTNIHLKGGKIIPYQLNTGSFKTTKDFETQLRMSFKIARDEALKYADGYVLIDDGISSDSYAIGADSSQKFTFWKLRYAEKSINFWVEYGDFQYEPPQGYQIHYINTIDILNADDLKNTDFACYLGLNLQPVNLAINYNPFTNTLTLKPTKENPDIKFKDIGFIKFGSTKDGDQNFCDPTSFQYKTDSSDITDDHVWTYQLSSTQAGMKPLVAVFTQLDDIGTINVEITTKEDFDSGKKIIYRVPDIVYDAVTNFPKKADLKKKLSNFIKVKETPFQYSIFKDATDATTLVWSSDPNRLYFSDFFVMDSGIFDMNPDVDQPLLGMGERAGSIFYKNEQGGIHSRYTFDQANPIDDGLPPGRNMYGYQPFYAFQSSIKTTNDWFGVFDVSSYATDYILFSQNQDKHTQIHKITIGGTINKFFFIGSKPDDIIKTYSKLVGNPTVPPLWAFGWHQCRFGYKTDAEWWEVYQQYGKNDLPLDTMWADIDYMDDYKLFTISQQSYATLPQKVDLIKKDDRYFVPIMDAGVAVRLNQGYKALDLGLEKDVFIKQDNHKDPLTAGVWCGNAYFPDFFKPETVEWWSTMFDDLYTEQGLHFDGIWLDENEATNFCNGYCKPEERPADSYRNKPFYVPGWRDLEDKALGVDGWHDSIERREYDVHNLFPLMQTKATADFLISQKKRPYILTRSNFPGIGKYGHHWMGDNWSTVDYMKLSVDGVYSYNLFALPFMGSDICGFNGDAAPDLCTRWHILGSLYPFARNHNQNASASQEPYVFNQTIPGTSKKYVDVIRTALINRYSFIKYYYSSFYNIYLEGGSFFKPLFYEYPQDKKAFIDVEVNILLGDAMKLSMETTTLDFVKYPQRQYYFPKDRWCQILPSITDASKDCFDSPGDANGYLTLNSNIEAYYIHLRNGYVLPYQDAQKNNVRKTKDLEKYPTDLWILPLSDNQPMPLSKPTNGVARGYLVFDDGVSALPAPYAKFEFYLIKNQDGKSFQFTVTNVGTLQKGDAPKPHEILGNIYLMWATKTGTVGIKSAKITTNTGGTATIALQPVDPKTDILVIPVSDSKNQYMFWDIKTIDLLPQ